MMVVLGHLLPITFALALSSVPILSTILILLSENKRRSSVPYLAGWVLGIAVVVVAFTLLVSVLAEPAHGKQQLVNGLAQIVIGLALVGFAVAVWRRPRGEAPTDGPKWLSAVGSLGPWSSFGLGLVLNLRPKSVFLSAAAALSVHGAGLTAGATAIVISIYTLLSSSTVAVPVILTLVSPAKTEPWLLSTRAWLFANNRTVTILIMLMIGVVVVGNGLTRL